MATFVKVSTFLAIIASLQQLAVATPPACLLACVAQVNKNNDKSCSGLNSLSCICSNESDDILKCLDDICPNGDADTAKKAFESSCDGYADVEQSSSAEESSSTEAPSSTETESSAEASSTEESSAAPSSSSSAQETSEAAPSSAQETSEAAPSSTQETSEAAPSSTLATSSVAQETSSTVATESSSAPGVATQTDESGANKLGMGALVGLIGAALL